MSSIPTEGLVIKWALYCLGIIFICSLPMLEMQHIDYMADHIGLQPFQHSTGHRLLEISRSGSAAAGFLNVEANLGSSSFRETLLALGEVTIVLKGKRVSPIGAASIHLSMVSASASILPSSVGNFSRRETRTTKWSFSVCSCNIRPPVSWKLSTRI